MVAGLMGCHQKDATIQLRKLRALFVTKQLTKSKYDIRESIQSPKNWLLNWDRHIKNVVGLNIYVRADCTLCRFSNYQILLLSTKMCRQPSKV